MKVQVGISNRHVHLTEDDYKILFGGEDLIKRNDLVQPNCFASTSTVKIIGSKGFIDNVRVLGPFRLYTQVEVSNTDTYKLGIKKVVRNSGDLEDAEVLTIEGPKGSIIRKCAIIATRHIHINTSDIKKYNLDETKLYKVKIDTEKGAILDNVYLKASSDGVLELHLDTDDANGCLLNAKGEVELIL